MSALDERWHASAVEALEEAENDFGPGGVLKAPHTWEEVARLKAKYPGEFIPLTHLLTAPPPKARCRTCSSEQLCSTMVSHGGDREWRCADEKACLTRAARRDGDAYDPASDGAGWAQHSYRKRIAKEDEVRRQVAEGLRKRGRR